MADLSVFLPWTVFSLLERTLGGKRPWKRERGTVLFCDIAGFTPLTEALSVIGREGAEELTRLLNAYFSTMIAIVEQQGGDVLRFGGDSMTIFFPGEAKAQAMRASARMMEVMGRFQALETRAGTFGLSIKIGAAHGDVMTGILGNGEVGYDYYAAGAPLDESADAEHEAVPGQVICCGSFCENVPPGLRVEPLARGFCLLRDVSGDPSPLSFGTKVPSQEILRRVVPPYLIERAGEGVLGEHRGTAVVFMAIEGLRPREAPGASRDSAADAYHAALDGLYGLIASTARRYGGLLSKLDMGDKGSKALLLFGSPNALERREEMALRAALELVHSKELPDGVTLRTGITSAPLFTGPVGGVLRREFTVIGDGINLASRLMQAAAPGQVLCDEAMARGAGRRFAFTPLPPRLVKGKKEAVQAFEPAGEAEEARGGGRLLVGRREILGLLKSYLKGEAGGPLCLSGEAGAGKTALLEAAAEEARALGLPVTRARLGTYSQDRPFSAWRGAVRAILGLEKTDGAERARAARDEALSREPAGFRALLNLLLDIPEEHSASLRNLGPRERRDLTLGMLVRLVEAAGPRVYLIDGLQWADPLSLDLVSRLLEGARAAPWRLIASTRGPIPEALAGAGGMVPVPLAPLSPGEVEELLRKAHGFGDFPPDVREWFCARSSGNPAVVSALVAALDATGLLQRLPAGIRVDSDRLFATAFPETLEGLYLARVDPLPRLEREVLQYASILGLSVSFNLLLQVCKMGEEHLRECLGALGAKNLLGWDSWGARPYLRFHEALLRDAIYRSLPYSLKRIGHLRVAEYLESDGAGTPKLWPSLAHHFEQADARERAKHYHRLSGRVAAERFDNVTALRHLEYVCASNGTEPEDVEDAFTLMEVYTFLGRWGDAKGVLRPLQEKESRLGLGHRARLQNYVARDAETSGNRAEAERVLLRGIALARRAGDKLLEAKGYVNLVGHVYGPTGQMGKAKRCLKRVLSLPQGPGQKIVRTTAAMNLGIVFWHMGRLHSAEKSFLRASREASLAGLPLQKGMIANNLCALFCEAGRFVEATSWGKRAVRLLETFSVRGALQDARYNLALAGLSTGDVPRAKAMLDLALREAITFGNQVARARALQGLSQAAWFEGDIRGALGHGAAAMGLFKSQRNARDYRFRLLDVSQMYHSFGASEFAAEFWEARSVAAFLKETPGDPVADVGLKRISAWMSGDQRQVHDPEAFVSEGLSISKEERLLRLLWVAEAAMNEGPVADMRTAMKRIQSAAEAWPYFDCQLRVLRLMALLRGGLHATRKGSSLRLLSRSMGGIWGLRLLCLIASQERDARKSRILRKKALARLAYLKAHSPTWAWEKASHFPEIRPFIGS